MKEKTLEQRAAETILEAPKKVTIGDKTYDVKPPTVATLIMVSEAVSRLPHSKLNENKIIEETLACAKDCKPLGEIVAILILGAKNCHPYRVGREVKTKKLFFGLIKYKVIPKGKSPVIDPVQELAEEILENYTPKELTSLVMRLLNSLELADFFGLTTFLTEVNLLRETKVGN